MGYKVQVYIYDLTQGMARTMGPALIGRPIDGVWHTAVVVYGKEYFYGGTGIEFCNPGGTMLGQPLKVEDLGETQITENVFQDYLRTQSQDRFRGDKYDLLRHNCNNFSHETAQFLVGKGIPQHILDLPNEILATPLGQMLAPMIQQMTPSGNSLPSNIGNGGAAANGFANGAAGGFSTTSNTQKEIQKPSFPYKDFITFDQPLKVDGLAKKLDEFNSNQKDDTKLTDSEVKVVLGIAKGLVRLSDENFSILTKIQKWEKSQVFPLLDIIRYKCLKPSFDNPAQMKEVLSVFENNLSSESQINSMLAARGLSNILSNPKLQHILTEFDNQEKIICSASALLPTSHQNLEISLASLLYNVSVLQIQKPNLEGSILVASSIATQVLPSLTQDEAIYRSLMALGNIIVTGPAEVKEFLQSMEIGGLVKEYTKKEEKIASCSKEILKLLGTSSDGLDLD